MERLLCVVIGYLFGLIQTGYIYGKMNKIDIRKHGSGNAGTTNALRTLGWKAGVITFIGDCLKCVIAVVVARLIFANSAHVELLAIYTGLGAVLGHNFPFYLNFKGGKGIAASVGLTLAFGDLRIFFSCVILFFTVLAVTKYVSVGSMCIYACFIIQIIVYGLNGDFGISGAPLYELFAVAGALTVLAVWQHRANIKRLIAGNENKSYLFGKKK